MNQNKYRLPAVSLCSMRVQKFLFFISLHFAAYGACFADDFFLYEKYQKFLDAVPAQVRNAFFYQADTQEKVVALTFDDGPLANTPDLIRVLESTQTPATFFLICDHVKPEHQQLYHPPLLEVGMHTMHHQDYRKSSNAEMASDIRSCADRFRALDWPVHYFRPAYGVINETVSQTLADQKIRGILWSLDSLDWTGLSGENWVRQVTDHLKPGAVVLLHDRLQASDLSALIKAIQSKEYQIVSLKKLMSYGSKFPGGIAS